MNIRRTVVRGIATATIGTVAGVGWADQPAHADCVYAEFYVTRQGDTPIWVVGENDPCLTSTPWTWAVTDEEDLTRTGLPHGTPNGYHRDTRVPSPL